MISDKNAPRFLYAISFLLNMLFIVPVIMLFYGYKGVSMGDFFLIQGLSHLMIFVLEIPSGYISDVFSRKSTIIFGLLGWMSGYFSWIFGTGFWFILLGEILFAFGISLLSGTTEAYLYDILKRRKKEGLFHKKNAKFYSCAETGALVAALSGAFIYQAFGPDMTAWLSVFALLLALGIAAFLPDVPESRRQVAKEKSAWQDILDISKYAVKHPEIKWLMIFPAFYGSLTYLLMWGMQSVMTVAHIPVFMFSIIYGVNAFARTGWSAFSGVLLEKLGLNKIILLLCTAVFLAIFAAAVSTSVPYVFVYMCLGLMILGAASSKLSNLVTSALVNHRVQSDERATVLSVKSMVNRFMSAVCMMALKPLFDNFQVNQVFLIAMILLLPIYLSAHQLMKIKLKMR